MATGGDGCCPGHHPDYLHGPSNRRALVTQTTTTSSLIVHSLSTYLGPDPFVCIYFTPHSPSLAFAYVQASYNITPSAPTNFTNMSALYFDPDGAISPNIGYSMAKSQLILLHTNPTQANLYSFVLISVLWPFS